MSAAMERCTKTDLRRVAPAPRATVPRPSGTGGEEHALLFGEAGDDLHVDSPPQPAPPDDNRAER